MTTGRSRQVLFTSHVTLLHSPPSSLCYLLVLQLSILNPRTRIWFTWFIFSSLAARGLDCQMVNSSSFGPQSCSKMGRLNHMLQKPHCAPWGRGHGRSHYRQKGVCLGKNSILSAQAEFMIMDSRLKSQPYHWQDSTEATQNVMANYLLCDDNMYPEAFWEEHRSAYCLIHDLLVVVSHHFIIFI